MRLVQTCSACPEQYDVFDGAEQVGYMRLRHGVFTVDVPDAGGETVYVGYPEGDGIFEWDERDVFLTIGLAKITESRAKSVIADMERY